MKLSFYGNLECAHGASHILGQIPSSDLKAVTLDKELVTVWAICVLSWVPWKISDIYIV